MVFSSFIQFLLSLLNVDRLRYFSSGIKSISKNPEIIQDSHGSAYTTVPGLYLTCSILNVYPEPLRYASVALNAVRLAIDPSI